MRPSRPVFFNSILLRETDQNRVAQLLAQDPDCTAYVSPPQDGWTTVLARCCDAPGAAHIITIPPREDPQQDSERALHARQTIQLGAHLCRQLGVAGLLHVSPSGTERNRLHCLSPEGELCVLGPEGDPEKGWLDNFNSTLRDMVTFVASVNDLFRLGWSASLVLGTAYFLVLFPHHRLLVGGSADTALELRWVPEHRSPHPDGASGSPSC